MSRNILIVESENDQYLVSHNEKLQLYPDIITFSTLLGKVKNTDEMRSLEEVRNYYGVKTNDIYLNKLNFKR